MGRVVPSLVALMVTACSQRALTEDAFDQAGGEGAVASVETEVDLDPREQFFATLVAIDDRGVALAHSANNRTSRLRWIDSDGVELQATDLPERSDVWALVPLTAGGWRVVFTEVEPQQCNDVNVVDYGPNGTERSRFAFSPSQVEDPAGCMVDISRDGSTVWSFAYPDDFETIGVVIHVDGEHFAELTIEDVDSVTTRNVAPNGDLLAVRELDGSFELRRIAVDGTEQWVREVEVTDDARGAYVHPNGSFDVVTSADDAGLDVVHVDGQGTATSEHVAGVFGWHSLFRSPDGSLVVVDDARSSTFRITAVEDDATRTTVIPDLQSASWPQLAWAPAGRWLAIVNDGQQEFYPGKLAIARW